MEQTMNENSLAENESISTTLSNGSVVTGTLWLHPSGKGSFSVEYQGREKSDGRTDCDNTAHMKSIAKCILRELAESS